MMAAMSSLVYVKFSKIELYRGLMKKALMSGRMPAIKTKEENQMRKLQWSM
ncbi:MAG: hypothetical protein JWP81_2498 [Ferruginibacter sp.]|nr:hypothetical protein [Ferruginibacter sp.]